MQMTKIKKIKKYKNLMPNTFIIENKSIGLASILVGTICEHPFM
jgi:hypothetical protein